MGLLNNYVGRITNLSSSSSGNAFLIEIKTQDKSKPYFILGIECGLPYHVYLDKLHENGYGVKDIDAILTSHNHQDHSESVKELHKVGKKIYAPISVFEKYGISDYDESQVFRTQGLNKYIYDNGYIKVFGIELEHYDDKDVRVENWGYVITINNDCRILFVIDTKYIKQDLSKYQFSMIFMETNYIGRSIHIAFENAKKEKDHANIVRYNRVLNSHLGLENASDIIFGNEKKKIKGFDLSKCELIIQSHLSSNWGVNPMYFNQYFKIKAPKGIKILTCLKNGGFQE